MAQNQRHLAVLCGPLGRVHIIIPAGILGGELNEGLLTLKNKCAIIAMQTNEKVLEIDIFHNFDGDIAKW